MHVLLLCGVAAARGAPAAPARVAVSSAPVRRFLPELIDLATEGVIDPGKVFDLALPLEQVAEGYRAMDQRTAIKSMLRP